MSGGLNGALGIGGFELRPPDRARGRMPVSEAVLQPYGIVHGGALTSLAETVTSRATMELTDEGLLAFGQTNEISFLRPVTEGTVHAEAVARHSGRTTWIWDVELRDDDGRLCALGRMTVAVRPRPQQR